jgi:proton-coupled amino acid transporter
MAGAKAAAGGSAAPLLPAQAGEGSSARGAGGGATSAQTLGNVVVSIVGTGVLGLPYAFRAAGWVAGSLGVAAAGFATLYCMLLLVSTLARPHPLPPHPHTSYCSAPE